ncbi:MAG: PepSY domain-containing protein [Gammaproteobacteria bacterium]|nr:PepSY domain-containing protein [Gammaproteobacteria bacterium]MCC6302989.1 PepSY domain-containing protein [Gammaproteobacteria bacterium]
MRHLVLLSLLLISLAPPALFARDDDHEKARRLREAGEIQPLEAILEQVRRVQPGKVIEVDLDREHGIHVYEIEVLDADGVVWELELDARDGAVLKHKRD